MTGPQLPRLATATLSKASRRGSLWPSRPSLSLLLLLHPLYHFPHQISGFSQRRDHVALLRVVEFHPALHLPDTSKRACQPLCRAKLLLLATSLGLLLATPLLLTTLRHTISYPARALRRQPKALRLRYNVFSYTRGTRKLDMVPFEAHPRARKCREPAAGDRVTRPS
jgi:hypothetical protein